jgi:hypothetical protein
MEVQSGGRGMPVSGCETLVTSASARNPMTRSIQVNQMNSRILLTVASAVVLLASLESATASTIAEIEGQPANTVGLTVDSNPVVTAILAQPGTVNGRIYLNWTFLVNDGTGSMEIFASGAALAGLYTPKLGDAITATGTYSPYHERSLR